MGYALNSQYSDCNCTEQTRRVASIPGRDKKVRGSTGPYTHALDTLNVEQCSYTRIQKAAGANVGSFVFIIYVIFFSPVCGWVWNTKTAYTILIRKLEKYLHPETPGTEWGG